jgi:transcriptional regulator with GAF, ATPase, and Fis domain
VPLVYHDLHPDGLACPECGAALKLQLLASQVFDRQPAATSPTREATEPVDYEDTVTTFKRELVSRALRENGGVMTRAAKALNLKYTTFVAMAHRLGVAKNDGRKEAAEGGSS